MERRIKATMSINIDLALNMLYQRQITSREQLLNEMLRVKMTQKEIHDTASTAGTWV